MKILKIDGQSLLEHTLRAAQMTALLGGDAAGFIYSPQTAVWVMQILLGEFARRNKAGHYLLEYPEQVLSTRAYGTVCEELKQLQGKGYTFSITTSSVIPLSRIGGWDERIEVKNGVEYAIEYGYGWKLDSLWEFQQ